MRIAGLGAVLAGRAENSRPAEELFIRALRAVQPTFGGDRNDSGVMSIAELDAAAPDLPITPADQPTLGDRVFRLVATAGAATALGIVGIFFVYLVNESRPAFAQSGVIDLFTKSTWNGPVGEFGVFGMLIGTIIMAVLAVTLAVPLAIGMALFVNEYAPRRVAQTLTTAIDLLAAIPSLIFGMWGLLALDRQLFPVARWFGDHLVAIPIFRIDDGAAIGRSAFVGGVVVGMMMLPIVTSVSREVMARAPRDQCEGALALGGTRWGMIKAVILPFGRSGIIGGALLGFGRALGETIAVYLVIQQVYDINWHVLETGVGSIAAHIASRFGEATPLEQSGLIAAGLALFLLTFVVNLIARLVTRRSIPS
jgi:phosphate transport system permease protein